MFLSLRIPETGPRAQARRLEHHPYAARCMLLSSFDRRFIGGERALLLTTLGVDYIVSVQTSYNAQQATLSPDPKVLPLATDGAIGELSWGGSTTATNFR